MRYASAYRLMLTYRVAVNESSSVCWRRRFAPGNRSKSRTTTTPSGSSQRKPNTTAQESNSSPQQQSHLQSTASSHSRLSAGSHLVQATPDDGSSGVSIPVKPNFAIELFILFAVSGKRRTLDVKNVNVQDHPTDHSFFMELLRRCRQFRGFWRHWFSLWVMNHCDFVQVSIFNGFEINVEANSLSRLQFQKLRANRVVPSCTGLPDEHHKDMYDWSPRPPHPEAKMPPVDAHEFREAFNSCSSNCVFGRFGWHECCEPFEGIDSMLSIPKRREPWVVDGYNRREVAWGIQANLEISMVRMATYHCLILLGPFAFWAVWQSFHRLDFQDASTPAMVVLMLLSLWWTVLASAPLLKQHLA